MIQTILMFVLKIVLQGVYGRVMSQIEEAAETKKQGALLQAQTIQQSADAEVAIEKAKEVARDKYITLPKNDSDPMNVDQWNGVEKK